MISEIRQNIPSTLLLVFSEFSDVQNKLLYLFEIRLLDGNVGIVVVLTLDKNKDCLLKVRVCQARDIIWVNQTKACVIFPFDFLNYLDIESIFGMVFNEYGKMILKKKERL